MFSKYLTNLEASSTHLDTVPTNPWQKSQDAGVRNCWPGLDLHNFIQDLVNVLAPLRTLIRVQEMRITTLEEAQRATHMPVSARRILAVETSLASLNANIEEQASWMSIVHARLKSLEASIAATSAEAVLPHVGKPEV